MTKYLEHKTTFTKGEITPDLLGRGEFTAYTQGAAVLSNVFIQPTGGVTRRAGLRHITTTLGDGRLIGFELLSENPYLLAFSNLKLQIYQNNILTSTLDTVWTTAQVKTFNWVQTSDSLLIVHPSVPPKILRRTSTGAWEIVDWKYNLTSTSKFLRPVYKFADDDVTITASSTTGGQSGRQGYGMSNKR